MPDEWTEEWASVPQCIHGRLMAFLLGRYLKAAWGACTRAVA